jgi:hypothetical protein
MSTWRSIYRVRSRVSITIFVMPPSNHYVTTQHSHRVITDFYDLQLFLFPTSHKLTCVLYWIGFVRWPPAWLDDDRETSACLGVDQASGWIRPSLPDEITCTCETTSKGVLMIVLIMKFYARGEASSGNSLRPSARIPNSVLIRFPLQGVHQCESSWLTYMSNRLACSHQHVVNFGIMTNGGLMEFLCYNTCIATLDWLSSGRQG